MITRSSPRQSTELQSAEIRSAEIQSAGFPLSEFAHAPFPSTARAETVVLYPTYGHLTDEGRTWRIPINGVIYEPGVVNLRRRLLLRLLRKVMDVEAEALQSPIFLDRIGAFVAATEK